jgi:hypothetical protein
MVVAFIFAAHLIFALIVFTKKWQDEDITSGLLNIGLIGILFSVGWTITGMVAKLVMDQKGLGIFFDRDAFSFIRCIITIFLLKPKRKNNNSRLRYLLLIWIQRLEPPLP